MKTNLLLVVLLCALSCKCKIKNNDIENTNMENAKVETEESNVIAKGNLYGSGAEGIEAQNLIITNQNDWEELMVKMNSVNKVSDSFSETEIDFSKYSLIAVFDNVKGSGGHRLEIVINKTAENTIVNINKVAPTGNATSVMTQPYQIVKISNSNLPIKFLDQH